MWNTVVNLDNQGCNHLIAITMISPSPSPSPSLPPSSSPSSSPSHQRCWTLHCPSGFRVSLRCFARPCQNRWNVHSSLWQYRDYQQQSYFGIIGNLFIMILLWSCGLSSLSPKRQIWGRPFLRFWLKLKVRKTQCNQIRKVKVFSTWKLNVRTNSPFLVSLWRTRNTPCPDVEWWSTWKGGFSTDNQSNALSMQIANPKKESENNFAKYTMAAASLLDRVPWNQG